MKVARFAFLSGLFLYGGIAVAQDSSRLGFETGVSTLGAYVAPTYEVNDKFSLRAPLHFGSADQEFEFEGNTVDGTFGVTNGTLMADFSPWATAFRVSGGLGIGGYKATGSVTDIVLDGVTYAGASSVAIQQKQNVAPVLSIGFAKEFNNGFTVFADLGGRITSYEVSVQTEAALTDAEQADLDESVATINNDLSKIWATPFVTIGLGYKF